MNRRKALRVTAEGLGEEHPWQTAGRRRTPVPAARDPKRGRRDTRWEQRSVPRPLPCLDHQLSKSAGAKRRATSPASLIPPASSHSEEALPLSTSPARRVPRVAKPAKTFSRLIPCAQRSSLSLLNGAKGPSRLIPHPAGCPKSGEWSSKSFSYHAHCRKRNPISGECLMIPGE